MNDSSGSNCVNGFVNNLAGASHTLSNGSQSASGQGNTEEFGTVDDLTQEMIDTLAQSLDRTDTQTR